MATARRVGWTLLSVVHLLFGLGLCVGFFAADGGEYGPYLIGVTCGVMVVLLAICVQMMKGVRIGGRGARRRIQRMDGGAGIEIRLRRGPGTPAGPPARPAASATCGSSPDLLPGWPSSSSPAG